jgi:hypothetical protein
MMKTKKQWKMKAKKLKARKGETNCLVITSMQTVVKMNVEWNYEAEFNYNSDFKYLSKSSMYT